VAPFSKETDHARVNDWKGTHKSSLHGGATPAVSDNRMLPFIL